MEQARSSSHWWGDDPVPPMSAHADIGIAAMDDSFADETVGRYDPVLLMSRETQIEWGLDSAPVAADLSAPPGGVVVRQQERQPGTQRFGSFTEPGDGTGA